VPLLGLLDKQNDLFVLGIQTFVYGILREGGITKRPKFCDQLNNLNKLLVIELLFSNHVLATYSCMYNYFDQHCIHAKKVNIANIRIKRDILSFYIRVDCIEEGRYCFHRSHHGALLCL